MATALQEDGKEHVRAAEQLATRWSAPEVVAEGKCSVQSDVWAAGVLVHEVFAGGVLPCADQFDDLTETSSFVREGGQLSRPSAEACPVEVCEQLMLPCFAADPADRPTFGELCDVAVRHGAEEQRRGAGGEKEGGRADAACECAERRLQTSRAVGPLSRPSVGAGAHGGGNGHRERQPCG